MNFLMVVLQCFFTLQLSFFIFMFNFQRFYKKAAAFVLRAVAKHSPELAQVS